MTHMPEIDETYKEFIPKFNVSTKIKDYKLQIERQTYQIMREHKYLLSLRNFSTPIQAIKNIEKVLPKNVVDGFNNGMNYHDLNSLISKYSPQNYLTYKQVHYNTKWDEVEKFYNELILLLKSISQYCIHCETIEFDGKIRNITTFVEYEELKDIVKKLEISKKALEERAKILNANIIIDNSTTPI